MVTKQTVKIYLDCVGQLEIGQAGYLLNRPRICKIDWHVINTGGLS